MTASGGHPIAEPLVSVVIAVRNGEGFLPRCLESVRAQTYPRIELIIVDGASQDRSAEIAASYGATVLDQDGDGFMDAWNQGLAAANGELFAIIDCDDYWNEVKIEAQVRYLGENPEVDYVTGMCRFFVEDGFVAPPSFHSRLLDGDKVAHMPGTLMCPLAVFEELGPFRTDLTVASDIEWFQRLGDMGYRGAVVPDALIHKSVHDHNLSFGSRAEVYQGELLTLLRDSVRRRAT